MRELHIVDIGARSALGFVIPRAIAERFHVVAKDDVFFTELLEGGVRLHFFNPSYGVANPSLLQRRVIRGGKVSLIATVPIEYHDRLQIHAGGDRVLCALARDGLSLYPWSEARVRAFSLMESMFRAQRDTLHVLGSKKEVSDARSQRASHQPTA